MKDMQDGINTFAKNLIKKVREIDYIEFFNESLEKLQSLKKDVSQLLSNTMSCLKDLGKKFEEFLEDKGILLIVLRGMLEAMAHKAQEMQEKMQKNVEAFKSNFLWICKAFQTSLQILKMQYMAQCKILYRVQNIKLKG